MKKLSQLLTLSVLALSLFSAAPKAHATAPTQYQGAMIPCFFMSGGFMFPMCVGTLGTMMLANSAMGTGGLALLDGESESKQISINDDLQELVNLEAISPEQAQVISKEISQKIQASNGQMAFNVRGLTLKGSSNQKVTQLMKDNQISRVTAVYLARLAGQNLKF